MVKPVSVLSMMRLLVSTSTRSMAGVVDVDVLNRRRVLSALLNVTLTVCEPIVSAPPVAANDTDVAVPPLTLKLND